MPDRRVPGVVTARAPDSVSRGIGPSTGHNNVFAIFTMRADGSHIRQITQIGTGYGHERRIADFAPMWSPGGHSLAFDRENRMTGHHAIFTLRLGGSGLKRITPWSLDASRSDYSPGGRWLVFRASENASTNAHTYLVTPNGTRLPIVTHGARTSRTYGSSSFSPNGKKITVSSAKVVGGEPLLPDIFVIRVDGSSQRRVLRTPNKFESASDWGPQPNDKDQPSCTASRALTGGRGDSTVRMFGGRARTNGEAHAHPSSSCVHEVRRTTTLGRGRRRAGGVSARCVFGGHGSGLVGDTDAEPNGEERAAPCGVVCRCGVVRRGWLVRYPFGPGRNPGGAVWWVGLVDSDNPQPGRCQGQ
jgi:hypothetical protein